MSNNKKTTILLVVVLALAGITTGVSCRHDPQVYTVSFGRDVVPVLTAYCTLNSSCHAGGNGYNQQTNLDSDSAYYTIFKKGLVNVANPAASLLYAEMVSGEMPVPPAAPVPAAQQALILEWIKQGAKNN